MSETRNAQTPDAFGEQILTAVLELCDDLGTFTITPTDRFSACVRKIESAYIGLQKAGEPISAAKKHKHKIGEFRGASAVEIAFRIAHKLLDDLSSYKLDEQADLRAARSAWGETDNIDTAPYHDDILRRSIPHLKPYWAGKVEVIKDALALLGSEEYGVQARTAPVKTAGQPAHDDAEAQAGGSTRAKRSTEKGEGRTKLIAALTAHHKYAENGCLNFEPIGNNKLAKEARVSISTASTFFKKQFKGHDKYKVACRDSSGLVAALKMLNGEYSPHLLFGRVPAGEKVGEDE